MEYRLPSEKLQTYNYTSGDDQSGLATSISYTGQDWFKDATYGVNATGGRRGLRRLRAGYCPRPRLSRSPRISSR